MYFCATQILRTLDRISSPLNQNLVVFVSSFSTPFYIPQTIISSFCTLNVMWILEFRGVYCWILIMSLGESRSFQLKLCYFCSPFFLLVLRHFLLLFSLVFYYKRSVKSLFIICFKLLKHFTGLWFEKDDCFMNFDLRMHVVFGAHEPLLYAVIFMTFNT